FQGCLTADPDAPHVRMTHGIVHMMNDKSRGTWWTEVATVRRAMNRLVMITCALTGAGDTVGRSEHVPVTPEQIADAGIAAARAGATIVHVHVRDPQTGQGSREVAFSREAVERIRASDVDVVINTTAGMG